MTGGGALLVTSTPPSTATTATTGTSAIAGTPATRPVRRIGPSSTRRLTSAMATLAPRATTKRTNGGQSVSTSMTQRIGQCTR